MIDLDAIKARLAAVHTAGASGITARLADHGIRVIVQMQSWEGNTAHEADAAVTHLLGHAPTDLTVLIAEVERLRARRAYEEGRNSERAAVVAWLRVAWGAVNLVSTEIVSAEIERGEHRRGEQQ